GEISGGEGGMRSGDIGTADADGNFYIVDRLKELMKYKGFEVPAAELEGLVLAHPAVADAAVIAVSDLEAGEIPKALVVPKPAADVSEQELIGYVAERVAPYKRGRIVEVVAEIPRSPSGEISRPGLLRRESPQDLFPPRALLMLWTCTSWPCLIGLRVSPIRTPYSMTSAPSARSARATLWPSGTRSSTASPIARSESM